MHRLKYLNPYDRHKLIINEYILNHPGSTNLLKRDTSYDKRDIDVIKENHRFLWNDEEVDTWEKQLARKYYDKLFKEYCISDLSRYKENKIALRWRTEKEVVSGKGQFTCGNKICNEENLLRSWEVNFAYLEQGAKKNALIKLRLCPDCSVKLNYHSKKTEVKRVKKASRKHRKRCRSHQSKPEALSNDSQSSYEENNDVQIQGDEQFTSDDEHELLANIKEGSEQQTGNIWANMKLNVAEPKREEEFQRYLEDLLL